MAAKQTKKNLSLVTGQMIGRKKLPLSGHQTSVGRGFFNPSLPNRGFGSHRLRRSSPLGHTTRTRISPLAPHSKTLSSPPLLEIGLLSHGIHSSGLPFLEFDAGLLPISKVQSGESPAPKTTAAPPKQAQTKGRANFRKVDTQRREEEPSVDSALQKERARSGNSRGSSPGVSHNLSSTPLPERQPPRNRMKVNDFLGGEGESPELFAEDASVGEAGASQKGRRDKGKGAGRSSELAKMADQANEEEFQLKMETLIEASKTDQELLMDDYEEDLLGEAFGESQDENLRQIMYNILKVLKTSPDRAYELVLNEPDANVQHWTAVIEGYRKEGNFQAGLKIYREMRQRNILPNIVTYGTVLHLYLDKLPQNINYMRKVWQEMLDAGLQPNTPAYSAMIFAYGQSNMPTEAHSTFRAMRNANVRIDPRTYSTAFSKIAPLMQPDELWELFQRLQTEPFVLGDLAFNALLFSVAKTRLAQGAWKIYSHMKQKNILLGFLGFKGLLLATAKQPTFAIKNYFNLVDTVNELRITMKRDQPERYYKLWPEDEDQTNLWIYNIILSGARNHSKPVDAFEIFEQMKHRGIKPDIVSYTVLIDAFGGSGGSLEQMGKIIEEMKERGIERNSVFYMTLFDSYAKRGYVEPLLQAMEDFNKENLPDTPSEHEILLVLLKCYARAGDQVEALKIYRVLSEKGYTTPVSLNHMIQMFAMLRLLEPLVYFWKLEAKKFKPLRLPTFYLLFEALGECNGFKIWPSFLRDIKENHLKILSMRMYLIYLSKLPKKDESLTERYLELRKFSFRNRDQRLTEEEEEEFMKIATQYAATYNEDEME